MDFWKAGDSARIVDMPPHGQHLIGQVVFVVPTGGFGFSPDDVTVQTSVGRILVVCKEQIERINR